VYLYSRPVAEQRLYIPSLGFCLLLALGIQRLFLIKNRYFRIKEVPWIPYAAILIIGLFYSVTTVQRNFVWHDWLTLFSDSVAASPGSARVRNNFGLALAEKGLYEQARRQFEAALQLCPDFTEARNNLGTACLDQGKVDEAITHFQASLGLDPEYAMAHKNLGVAWREKGDVDKALFHFRTALRLRPAFPAAHFHLGLALLDKKDYDRARHHFRRALEIDPDYAPAAEQLRFYRPSR
ncbi:MAG: tetratricopeptide repeat protein, partial [Desulfosudaceae bacterium]